MEDSLKRHDKVRLYYEIGCRFPGAAWEELRLGMDTIPQWERVAVVTDTGWVRHTVNALRFLIASEVRIFTTGEAAEGRAWIASPSCTEVRDSPVSNPPVRLPRDLPPRARRPSARPSPRGDR